MLVRFAPKIYIQQTFSNFEEQNCFYNNLRFYYPYIFATQILRPKIIQIMSSIKYIRSLKYQRFAQSGYKDIGIRKFVFLVKTQLLSRAKFEERVIRKIILKYIIHILFTYYSPAQCIVQCTACSTTCVFCLQTYLCISLESRPE